MRKLACLVMLMIMSYTGVMAKKMATLAELAKPDIMVMGNGRIYISEGASIFVYSLKDFRFIKKFGKAGWGPREFNITIYGPPMLLFPHEDKLIINSNTKLSVFTIDGEFVKEFKTPPSVIYRPFANQYLGTMNVANDKGDSVMTINLFNEKLEKIKELYQTDFEIGVNMSFNFPISSFEFTGYKERIYVVAGKEGFAIDVFDKTGKKLYRIAKKEPVLTLPKDYQGKTINWFQTNPNYKQFWAMFKDRVSFKENFPAILFLEVNNDLLYVGTYRQKDGMTECIILDLKGNEKKRVYIPYPINYGLDFKFPYVIFQGSFYKLIENEDEEAWELQKFTL